MRQLAPCHFARPGALLLQLQIASAFYFTFFFTAGKLQTSERRLASDCQTVRWRCWGGQPGAGLSGTAVNG